MKSLEVVVGRGAEEVMGVVEVMGVGKGLRLIVVVAVVVVEVDDGGVVSRRVLGV